MDRQEQTTGHISTTFGLPILKRSIYVKTAVDIIWATFVPKHLGKFLLQHLITLSLSLSLSPNSVNLFPFELLLFKLKPWGHEIRGQRVDPFKT